MRLLLDLVIYLCLFIITLVCFFMGMFSPDKQTGIFYIALSIWFLVSLQWHKNSVEERIGEKK